MILLQYKNYNIIEFMYYDADNNCVLIVITQLFWSVLTESLHYGPSMEMKILQSPSSPLPKSIIGSLNTTFMGHTLELLEVCKWRSYHSFSLKFQCLIYIVIWWIVFLARQLLYYTCFSSGWNWYRRYGYTPASPGWTIWYPEGHH